MSNLEKRTFSSQEIKSFISQWKSSGLSKKKFCENHGLKYYTFVSWFERYDKETEPQGFEEVKLNSTVPAVFAELVSGGKTIRFYQPFPPEYFQLLIG